MPREGKPVPIFQIAWLWMTSWESIFHLHKTGLLEECKENHLCFSLQGSIASCCWVWKSFVLVIYFRALPVSTECHRLSQKRKSFTAILISQKFKQIHSESYSSHLNFKNKTSYRESSGGSKMVLWETKMKTNQKKKKDANNGLS